MQYGPVVVVVMDKATALMPMVADLRAACGSVIWSDISYSIDG